MLADDSRHVFIVPPLRGPLSGGTLYNRGLLGALRAKLTISAVDLERGRRLVQRGTPGVYWLDSLYLEAFSELATARTAGQRLGLLLHYLPTLVRLGDGAAAANLSDAERRALAGADVLIVPSTTLCAAARRLGAASQPILVVEPARPRIGAHALDPRQHGVRAVLIGNIVPGKGVHELLSALACELVAADCLTLRVVGAAARDPVYARRCLDLVASSPLLEPRVTFLGERPPAEARRELAASNTLISASVQESYGMALAEARVAGVPVLAHAGGHSGAHVSVEAGGELARSHAALARACVRLARDPAEHARRIALARRERYRARSWHAAADELLAHLASCAR
jgi:hypothetical protein